MAQLSDKAKRAWGLLLVTHAVATRAIDRQLQAEGYSGLAVYDVLLALEDAPDRRMRMCELASRVVFSPSGLTRMIDRMERAGLVRREAHPRDRRSLLAVLTDYGLEERNRTWPRYRELIQEHFGQGLTQDHASHVVDALEQVLEVNGNPIQVAG